MFDINLIKKRKEILSECENKVELTIDLDDELYNNINEISIKENIDIEDILISAIIDSYLDKYEKEEDVDKVIDFAYLLIKEKEIYDDNKNYLVLDTKTLNKKFKIIK